MFDIELVTFSSDSCGVGGDADSSHVIRTTTFSEHSPASEPQTEVAFAVDPEVPADQAVEATTDVELSDTESDREEDEVSVRKNEGLAWSDGTFYIVHKQPVTRDRMHNQGSSKSFTMTLGNRVTGFTSYVDLEGGTEEDPSMIVKPSLLQGELLISEAERVCCYNSVSGMTSGISGSLFVTTLKLSLKLHVEDEKEAQNKILGTFDIPLSSIFAIYEVGGEMSDKKKKLSFGSNISNRVEGIFILCKNFKFYRFSFKFAGVDQGRNVVNALLHHVRPKKNDLLFAFEHSNYQSLGNSSVSTVWEDVRVRSQCPNFRVSRANENWQISTTLPSQFVVPGHVTDDTLHRVAALFQSYRPPVWVWGLPSGAAIYAQPVLNVPTSPQVESLLANFYGSRQESLSRRTIDLDKAFPTQVQMEASYSSLVELHCVESEKEAEQLDSSYLAKLEASGWLGLVSTALKCAVTVCELLLEGSSVVLVENEGRATAILVASLAEILLEEEVRRRVGFESLIQNNFVSLGFPFSRFHQLCSRMGEPGSVCPLFYLFLDSVHQLTQQFPSQFEFEPEYLISIWDAALLPVFDTFIFDSEHDRAMARTNPETPLALASVWNWGTQFSEEQIQAWENPLYDVLPIRPARNTKQEPSSYSIIQGKVHNPVVPDAKPFLPVSFEVGNLHVWLTMLHRSVNFYQTSHHYKRLLAEEQRRIKRSINNILNSTQRSSTNSHS